MPGLTLNTNTAVAGGSSPSANNSNQASAANSQDPARPPSSPPRPTYSPITPPLNPVALPPPLSRPTYTHSSQREQVGVAPPAPEPIDFDSNPDALALKSAISILQLQRRKAAADMALLGRVKAAALADPEAFVRDLAAGRVGVEGDALFAGSSSAVDDEDDDSDDEEEEEDEEMEDTTEGNAAAAGQPASSSTTTTDTHPGTSNGTTTTNNHNHNHNTPGASPHPGITPSLNPNPNPLATESSSFSSPPPPQPRPQPPRRPWTTLPKPQNIVRCPPINWAQYAVVGESLDKLHAEQLARPSQGVPATLGPDGRYDFRADQPGRQEKLPGGVVAAPYAPGKDRVDRKPKKGPKR